MSKTLTARQYLNKKLKLSGHTYSISFNQAEKCMIAFTKYHLRKADTKICMRIGFDNLINDNYPPEQIK